MTSRFFRFRTKRSGFTLVELLIASAVLIIIVLGVGLGLRSALRAYSFEQARQSVELELEVLRTQIFQALATRRGHIITEPDGTLVGKARSLFVVVDGQGFFSDRILIRTACTRQVNYRYSIDTQCGFTCPAGLGPEVKVTRISSGGLKRNSYPAQEDARNLGVSFCITEYLEGFGVFLNSIVRPQDINDDPKAIFSETFIPRQLVGEGFRFVDRKKNSL